MNLNFSPFGFPKFRYNSFYKKPVENSSKTHISSTKTKEEKLKLPSNESNRIW